MKKKNMESSLCPFEHGNTENVCRDGTVDLQIEKSTYPLIEGSLIHLKKKMLSRIELDDMTEMGVYNTVRIKTEKRT